MKRVRSLDGIRAVAILLVLAGHTLMHLPGIEEETRGWLMAFANSGLGVRIFFVLSGYLITGLLLKEFTASGTIDLRSFYRRRCLRILPAFYVYLLVLTCISFWIPCGINLQTWLSAATHTWNYSPLWASPPPEGAWNLGHFWTLALEQQFYLFWPPLLLLAGPRRGLFIAIGLFIWCPLARTGSYFAFPDQRGLLDMMLHTGVDSLMMGSVAALLLQKQVWRERLTRFGGPVAAIGGVWLLLLSPLMGMRFHGSPLVAGMTLDALAAAWIISWVHRTPGSRLSRLLSLEPLPALGLISYSLYLWQQLFFFQGGPMEEGRWWLALGGALGAAWLSYTLVEKPFLRLKIRRSPALSPVA